MHGGGQQMMDEFIRTKYNCHRLHQRSHELPDGRLVPQGDQVPRGHEGTEVPHRRLRRPDHAEGRRRAAADCGRRHLPGAGKGHASTRAEWVGPYDDEKLGFVKVAKYYYYPGWWEPGATPHYIFNLAKWNELPKIYQAALYAAGQESGVWMTSKYDHGNPPALKRLVASGAVLRPFPQDVMDACYKAANELYTELSAKNEWFKKMHDHLVAYPVGSVPMVAGGRVHHGQLPHQVSQSAGLRGDTRRDAELRSRAGSFGGRPFCVRESNGDDGREPIQDSRHDLRWPRRRAGHARGAVAEGAAQGRADPDRRLRRVRHRPAHPQGPLAQAAAVAVHARTRTRRRDRRDRVAS